MQASGAAVERVLITRVIGNIYYSRIVMSLPDGERCSIDARPSDSLALALQMKCPIFVAETVARYACLPGAQACLLMDDGV